MLRKMLNIIRSFLFFLSTLIRKKKYDVIFYYPQHFNRSLDGENVFFKDLLLTCVNNRISYVIFEEPDFATSSKRSSVAIPFDFLYLLIVFLRKINVNNTSTSRKKFVKHIVKIRKHFYVNSYVQIFT